MLTLLATDRSTVYGKLRRVARFCYEEMQLRMQPPPSDEDLYYETNLPSTGRTAAYQASD